MLPSATTYDDLAGGFRWRVPDRFNIAADVCDRWAESEPEREALVFVDEAGAVQRFSYGDLQRRSARLAHLLAARGVGRGDRVGILLPQHPMTAVAHIAVYRLGAVAVPLFTLFGPEALAFRLADSGAGALVTDGQGSARVAPLRRDLPQLRWLFDVDGPAGGGIDLAAEMDGQSEVFAPVDTAADEPALIIYTSGTTGQPKGALHAHRVLLGHLPGVEMSHDFLPRPGDRFWTPADWAWIGGLLDVLLPALHHGIPVVARRFARFTGEAAFELIATQNVRNAFLPPTALRMMRAVPDPRARWDFDLRSVASGGESLGAELLDWGRRALGVTINEFYGQTECNMIVSSCGAIGTGRPGVMGRPVPGHRVEVLDGHGNPVADGVQGEIAVRAPDPVMFLEYWNNPAATSDKVRDGWLLTGDVGVREPDGFLRFVGRGDDIITSAGYRIGPGEVENCLIGHPAVHSAAVVGIPDKIRTQRVRAYLVLKPGHAPSETLAKAIQDHVRTRLSAHEYPREVRFVDSLPLTATGKIVRRELRDR